MKLHWLLYAMKMELCPQCQICMLDIDKSQALKALLVGSFYMPLMMEIDLIQISVSHWAYSLRLFMG